MGKRKNTLEEEVIKNKIRKLESKLKQRPRRIRIISSSSEDENNDEIVGDEEPVIEPRRVSPSPSSALPQESISQFDTLELPQPISPLTETPPIPGESSTNAEPDFSTEPLATPEPFLNPEPSDPIEAGSNECVLDDDILEILGDAPKPETTLGKNMHKDIAARWQEILKQGLSKDAREKLLEKYLKPANCDLMLPPILNPEAKAAVPEILAKRDSTILQKQNQIGIALAALSQVMELIISNETSKQKLLQPLSDACRIICDSHNAETRTRRSIILSSINVGLRDALAETTRDKYLFGDNVSEKLKVAKTVQRTGESLQKATPKPVVKNTTQYKNPRGHLNFRGQHRKTPNRIEAARARGVPPPPLPPPPQRAAQRSNNSFPPQRSRSPVRRTYRR